MPHFPASLPRVQTLTTVLSAVSSRYPHPCKTPKLLLETQKASTWWLKISLNCWPVPKPQSTPQGQDHSLWVGYGWKVSFQLPALTPEALSFSQEPRVPSLLNKRLISVMHTLLKRTQFPWVPTSHSGLQTSFIWNGNFIEMSLLYHKSVMNLF